MGETAMTNEASKANTSIATATRAQHPDRKLLHLLLVTLLLTGIGAGALHVLKPGEQMTASAKRFLASLDKDQLEKAQMGFDDPKRFDWHFIPKKSRKGLLVREMNKSQRVAAFGLLRASLSQVGYDKARTTMILEAVTHALEGKRRKWDRDPEKYYFTVFGKPDVKGKWGLSVEGHHLSLNFVVEDNKVIAHTPTFFGANPNVVDTHALDGAPKNTYNLEKEEIFAFDLVNLLDKNQLGEALIAEKAPRDVRDAGSKHPPAPAKEGIQASKLNPMQQHKLWALIYAYAENMPLSVADDRLTEIGKAGFDNIYFAWAGALKPGIGHYYRVEGPTFIIEYANTQPDAAGNPAGHPHAMWRDMRGDFGEKR